MNGAALPVAPGRLLAAGGEFRVVELPVALVVLLLAVGVAAVVLAVRHDRRRR